MDGSNRAFVVHACRKDIYATSVAISAAEWSVRVREVVGTLGHDQEE